jgi:phosphate transport system permease protein
MILGLLILVLANGLSTFWPGPLVELTLSDGSRVLGEVTREERYRPRGEELDALPVERRRSFAASDGWSNRRLIRTGNYDLYGDDFRWIPDFLVTAVDRPRDVWAIERREWGRAIGHARALVRDGLAVAEGSPAIAASIGPLLADTASRWERIRDLEKNDLGGINTRLERSRLTIRSAALEHGDGSPQHLMAKGDAAAEETALTEKYRRIQEEIERLRADNRRLRLVIADPAGRIIPEQPSAPDSPLLLSQVVRAYPANDLSLLRKAAIYLDRWWEFLASEPREANTEGGILPALFGTFMMTVMMSIAVAPFGVIAALYLREYARQGILVSTVRIAVNNLAGVPSIVYGAFGLGFFCYGLGGGIDRLLFPEKLPSPTFGTGGILWASLTLALLTVPVVIVATEEALAAVPRSMREGSFACGASRWQTVRRIVLPRATPGIMTGLILAMARGAGEVAPLMITGVVKLAPALPFDGRFPFIHLERSFMHLGFHIYDVGFQSRNSEAGKPMVFTTTLLLIALIAMLNMTAVFLRARLRRRFRTAQF